MQFVGSYPWWSDNSYTLVWPVGIPHGRTMDIVEVCVYIPDFENGQNRFLYNRGYHGKLLHTLTSKQRKNIEAWITAYRDRIRVQEEIRKARCVLEALMAEEQRLNEILH